MGSAELGSGGLCVILHAFWLVAILVLIAILGIGAWIGWTMATTPPPKPIKEIQAGQTEE